MSDENQEVTNETKVFISYSRKDKDFVVKLHQALVSQGLETWVDWEGIPLTADWWEEIEAGIDGADAFVFVISPDSLTSKVCNDEIEAAMESNKRLVPILHREPEKGNPMHPRISSHNWVFMRNEDELAANLPEMVETIKTDLGWVKSHTRILGKALDWEKKGQNSSFLLRGDELNAAEAWLSKASDHKEPAPTALQIDYIRDSRRDATRRRNLTVAGVLVSLVIAFLAVFAFYQSYQASVQRERAEQEADRAEQEAERANEEAERANAAELEALDNAERAASSATKLLIQPVIYAYDIPNALSKAEQELIGYEVDLNPSIVVAESLLNAARDPAFIPQDFPPGLQETTSMLNAITTGLEQNENLVGEEQLPELGFLYSKICRQVPFYNGDKTIMPACTEAIEIAKQVDNAWLNFQICSLQQFPVFEEMSSEIFQACARLDTLAGVVQLEEPTQDNIEPGSNDLWTFELDETQTVYILMSADNSNLDSFLELYKDDGTLLEIDDQSGGQNDALIVTTLEGPEKYTVIAHGYDVKTNGEYQLLISNEPINLFDNIALGNLTINTPIQDFLDDTEPDRWTFDGQADQTVGMNLTTDSGDLDGYIQLIGPNGSIIAEDDNSGGGLNPQIFTTLPDDGQYLIEATALAGAGDYSLEIFENVEDIFGDDVLGQLAPGVPTAGSLAVGATDIWTFEGSVGHTVAVAMIADNSELDPYLTLLAPDGSILMEDDDSFGDFNSLMVVDLPLTGQYTVLASSFFGADSSGDYQLELGDSSLNFALGRPPAFTEGEFDSFVDSALVDAPSTIFAEADASSDPLVNVDPGEFLEVIGRSANNSWLFVTYYAPDGTIVEGYVAENRLDYNGSLTGLQVISYPGSITLPGPDEDQPPALPTFTPTPPADDATLTPTPTPSPAGATPTPTTPPEDPGGSSGEAVLTVINDSSWDLCEIYISPTSSSEWGGNQLGGTLGPGGAASYTLQSDFYDILVVDCGGTSVSQGSGLDLSSDQFWTIEGGEEPPAEPTEEPAGGGNFNLTLANETNIDICTLFVSSSSASDWGDNRLGNPLSPGAAVTYNLMADTYDVLAQDCSGNNIGDGFGLDLLGADNYYAFQGDFGPPPEPTEAPTAGPFTLTLANDTDFEICFLYVSPSSASDWGEDRLGGTLPSGATINVLLEPDTYDVLAEDCENVTVATAFGIDVNEDVYWSLFE